MLSIVTRPTVATSVCTVQAHKSLLETGYTNAVTTGSAQGHTASFPQAFLRIGSADDRLEYEITPPSIVVTSAGGTIARGASDAGAGLKYVLGYSAKASCSANAAFTVPSGSPRFTAGAPQYAANFNWSYSVNSVLGIGGTLGFNSLFGPSSNGRSSRFFAFEPSFVASIALPKNSQFFAEYAYFSNSGTGVGDRTLIDYGLAHDFGSSLQVDIEVGVQPSTTSGQQQRYVGAGLSFMSL